MSMELLLEAERRGILPPDKKSVLDEARSRGLAPTPINFDRPVEQVRADITQLAGKQRERALKDWADHYVAKERNSGGIGMAIDNTVRTLARGTFVGPFLDEATAAANTITGTPYEETLAYQRARDRAIDKDYPALSTAGSLAGGIAGGVGAVRTAGSGVLGAAVAGPVATLPVARTVAGAAGQGAAMGAGYGAVSGFGEGQGGVGERAESALRGAAVGAGVGGALGAGLGTIPAIRNAAANQGEAGAYRAVVADLAEAPQGTTAVDNLANQFATGASAQTNRGVQNNNVALRILGEEMNRAGGDVAAAEAQTVQRLAQEFGVAPRTAQGYVRNLSNIHRESQLTLGEFQMVAGADAAMRGPGGGRRNPSNVDLDEVGRVSPAGTHDLMDYVASNGAPSSNVLRSAVTERQEALAPAMRSTLENIGPRVGNRPATIEDARDMIEAARQAGSAEYGVAYSTPVNNQVSLYWLPRMLNWHTNRALGRSGDAREAINRAVDQFYIPVDKSLGGGRIPMQTLQQLQDARGVLRGQMQSYRQSGRDDLVNAVQPIYDHVTRVMSAMSPAWQRANARWADMNFQRIGQELGEGFAQRAGPQFRQQVEEFTRLAPEAQNIVRIEFLQKLYDKLDNLGDTHSVSKLFTNDHSRNAIRLLFGDEAAVMFTRAVRDQRAMEATQRRVGLLGPGGSPTLPRQARKAQMETESGLLAAAQNASVSGVRGWIMQSLAQLLTERRNRPMANILTTPVNNTAQMALHIQRLREAEAAMQRGLDPTWLPGAVGAAAGGISGRFMGDK